MLPLSCGNSCAFVLVVLFFGRWVNKRPLILFPPQNLMCVLCLACHSLECKTSASLWFLHLWRPKNGGGAVSTNSAGTTGLFYPETHKMRLFPGNTVEHHCWAPKLLTTTHVLMKDEVIPRWRVDSAARAMWQDSWWWEWSSHRLLPQLCSVDVSGRSHRGKEKGRRRKTVSYWQSALWVHIFFPCSSPFGYNSTGSAWKMGYCFSPVSW